MPLSFVLHDVERNQSCREDRVSLTQPRWGCDRLLNMDTGREASTGGISKSARQRRPKLTKAQLERKRECDREAQRQIRLKTKNHIAHLESLVDTLQEAHHDAGRVSELVTQLKANQKEIARLHEVIRSIGKLVESVAQDDNTLAGDKRENSSSEPESGCRSRTGDPGINPPKSEEAVSPTLVDSAVADTASGSTPQETPEDCRAKAPTSPESEDSGLAAIPGSLQLPCPALGPQEFDQGWTLSSSIHASDCQALVLPDWEQQRITNEINAIAEQIVQDRTLDGRLWYLAGSLLNVILNMPRKFQTPMAYDQDIPVRAVLHGWATVEERYYLDPGWIWLRHLDQVLYSNLGVPERLAIVRMMRLQYQAQVQPYLTSSLPLPGFMQARPAQKFMEHDPLMEHFVWPGMREQILFAPRKYATNKFMDSFRAHCRFVWPHNPEDTFLRDNLTGLYSYSSDFVQRQNDLRCWTMRSDFFKIFPELVQDIPAFDKPPRMSQLLLPAAQSLGPKQKLLHGRRCSDSDVDNERRSSSVSESPDVLPLGMVGHEDTVMCTGLDDWAGS